MSYTVERILEMPQGDGGRAALRSCGEDPRWRLGLGTHTVLGIA